MDRERHTRIGRIPMARWMTSTAMATIAACVPGGGAAPPSPAQPVSGYDVVIAGGRIVDGTGSAWFYGDVAIQGGRIVRVAPAGLLAGLTAVRTIDARGLVVAPGFIDIQSHSREAFLTGDGRIVSKVTQGITTEIMGEGWTNAPANAATRAMSAGEDTAEARVNSAFQGRGGFGRWLEAMERRGTSANFGSFVGSATVRAYAVGMREGDPSPAELDTMRAVVRDAMEDGAFGLASALIYPPDNYSSTDQLVELAKVMAPYGGVYITHMRSEADRFLEAIDEAIAIGRRGGVPVEIYHLKAAGRRNWPKAGQAIAKIDSARAAGQDVAADMYPYVAGGTALAACLPPWAAADGKLLGNLQDPVTRARIRAETLSEQTAWENLCQLAGPEGVVVSGFGKPEDRERNGQTLAVLAAAAGKQWVDALIDLTIQESARLGAMFFLMSEDNLALQMRQPWIKFGTDAGGVDPDSTTSLVHPRSYGTFPRILGRYVREQHVMPLEEAVRKMTSAVATRLSIQDRGVLRPGMFADVVVFDPATITDHATYSRPHQLSSGVRHLLVNGVEVVRDGRHTGAKPGRVVWGPGFRSVR
jgi:N-acyl-D-amino-acid deacylase